MSNYKSKSEAIKGYGTKLSKSERADCCVCAMASGLNIPYNKAHKFLEEEYGRKDKRGTFGFTSTNNYYSRTEKNLFGKKLVKHTPTDFSGERLKTVGQFLKYYKYRKGTFIISVAHHAFTIKNGVVIGNWHDATAKRVRLRSVWKVEKV